MRPMLIAVEGLDGTGKSRLASALATRLGADLLRTPGVELAPLRAPLDAHFAPSAVATQLFYAATVALASTHARASLGQGRSAVIDRYWLSTVVYAKARAASVDLACVAETLVAPDLTVYLYADVETRARRLSLRGRTAADVDSLRNNLRLELSYRDALSKLAPERVLPLDTASVTTEALADRVVAALMRGAGRA